MESNLKQNSRIKRKEAEIHRLVGPFSQAETAHPATLALLTRTARSLCVIVAALFRSHRRSPPLPHRNSQHASLALGTVRWI